MRRTPAFLPFAAAAVLYAALWPDPVAGQTAVPGLYQQTLRSTVLVIVPEANSAGSGWIVDHDRRLIVTNHHVTGAADRALVVFPAYRDGKLIAESSYYMRQYATLAIRGEVIESDPARDLAVIRLERLPPGTAELRLAATSPEPGDRLHSIGNPAVSAACWVYTDGAVRAVVRRRAYYHDGQVVDTTVIETTSPINHGDSGGPVVNDRGELVGVTSGGMTVQSGAKLMSWMIDVTVVRDYLVEAVRRSHASTAEGLAERGYQHYWSARYDRAITDFTAALRLDPGLATAYSGRGRSFFQKGDTDTAVVDLTAALDIRSNALDHCQRAQAYFRQKKFTHSIDDFTRAIAQDPMLSVAYCGRGHAHYEKKKYTKALADYGRAAELEPRYAKYRLWRGMCHLHLKSYRKAVEECTEAARLDPYDPQTFYYRGISLTWLKAYPAAIRDFTSAIALKPSEPLFYKARAYAYEARGDKSRARADHDKARELGG